MHKLPREVVRAKGFLDFADPEARGKKYVLQMVGGRPVLSARPWETGEARQSAMVFIGKGFDRERLLSSLEACELEPVSPERAPARR
jgi:G3E family GTPase